MGTAAEVCFKAREDIFVSNFLWSPGLDRGVSTQRAREEKKDNTNTVFFPIKTILKCFGWLACLPERVSQTQQLVWFPAAWQQREQWFSTAWRAKSAWQVRHWSGLGPTQCLQELSQSSQVSYQTAARVIAQHMIHRAIHWKESRVVQ